MTRGEQAERDAVKIGSQKILLTGKTGGKNHSSKTSAEKLVSDKPTTFTI